MPPQNPNAETISDFHFPKAGLHVVGPLGRQPARPTGSSGEYARTTRDCKNVRGYEAITSRDRGGSRAGQSKYIPVVVPATVPFVCQHLAVMASTKGTGMEQSASGRLVYLLAVSQGTVQWALPGDVGWTTPVNATGETPALNITGVMMSAANLQKMFFVDGINYVYFDPAVNSILKWTPTDGLLPRDSAGNGCRLICTWRGRTVLSGLIGDPQDWFMSRVSSPFDFDYFPPTLGEATVAIAGNNAPMGLIGDVITALIPASDDVLFFGGDHTIYAMKGDPANGGQVDLVSDITGIAFGEAWCKDPYGNIYFFGAQPSVWMMSLTNAPTRISAPIEPLLQGIDTGNTIIRLVWDHRHQEVHLYLTPDLVPAVTTHYTYEYRTQAWQPDTFGNTNLNPLCVVAYDGNLPGDRVVLLGGWDGFVRFIDHNATTDDGTPISSYVLIGPILTQELDEMLLKDIQGVLADASGDVTWDVLAADTAETAIGSVSASTGTFNGGRGPNQPVRVAAHAIYIKLSSTNRWAMETLRTRFAGRGKIRRRKGTS